MKPLLLFLLLPIAEIAAFAQVGDWIGALPTVGLVLLSIVAGSLLLRRQGLSVLRRAQEAAARGEDPVGAVFEGFCIVVAAFLLIVPGFLTDIVGLLLFVRPVRNALGLWLLKRMASGGTMRMWTAGTAPGASWPRDGGARRPPHQPAHQPGVIEGEFQEVDPDGTAGVPRLEESRWGGPGGGNGGGRP
ncbi:FxsA family protein [Azospirillum sp. SYSU D00513]|uniref:FxsA family protein n=1 Tax=Azospirillum sp. SYSU D00513 TaxID=2812561 RepID=UPI001A95FF60|nr:FxsA family protein [Azospirillum sp. SYSU D00513]